MAAIEAKMYQPSTQARMGELEAAKTEIAERLARAPADIANMRPDVANIHYTNVVRFAERPHDPDRSDLHASTAATLSRPCSIKRAPSSLVSPQGRRLHRPHWVYFP